MGVKMPRHAQLLGLKSAEKGFAMSTFVGGYLIVWFAVVVYVARLGRRQRQLHAEYEALRAACQWPDNEAERMKAA